jgi:outer membrane lipoprotein-sorting protein
MVREKVNENQQRVHALTGAGTISVETSEMSQSGSFELTLRKPDSLLIKIEGPFGIDVGSAMVTREYFAFYYSFQNRLLEGPTNPANLGKLFKIPVNFDDVMNLFTGGFFLSEDDANPSAFSIENEEFVLTYDRYTGTRRYWIDPQTMQIVKIHHLDTSGKLALEQLFSKFQTLDGVTIPRYVRVTMARERRRVSISYSDLNVNPANLVFVFDVPRNASRGHLQ